MKILIVAPTPFFSDRGTPIRVYEHVRALRSAGHAIRAVTYGGGKDIAGIDIRRVPTPWKGDAFFIESFWRRIVLDAFMVCVVAWNKVRYRPDLTICYLHSGFLMGYLASFFSADKIVFDCHGILANEIVDKRIVKNKLVINILKRLEAWMYRAAKQITVPSEVVKKKITSNYVVDEKKIAVVDDGIASTILEYHRDNEVLEKLRRDLAILADHKVLIFTGFISAIAGIDMLLEAMRLLIRTDKKITLVVVGYPNEDQYKDMAEKLGIGSSVRFTGRVNYFDLPMYLDLADIAVAPRLSQAEGNSKILNYLAIGLPVVCSDIPINHELAGAFAAYPKAPTAEALSATLAEELKNLPKLRLAKQDRIRYVKERYDWGAMAHFINTLIF